MQRRRVERVKGLGTTGQLSDATVQEEGWLDLVTMSSEVTAVVAGCGAGQGICRGDCVDLNNDPDNCGGCDETCSDADACNGGTCVGATACNACIVGDPPACNAAQAACDANPDCAALQMCANACADQACADDCIATYPDGLEDAQTFAGCLCTQDACGVECSTSGC